MNAKIWLVVVALIFALIISFRFKNDLPDSSSSSIAADSTLPTRRQLWGSLHRSRRMLVVYPSIPNEIASEYRDYYQNLRRESDWFQWHLLSDAEISTDSLGRHPIFLVGAIHSNRILQLLLPKLPIKRLKNGFRFRDQDYTSPDDVMFLLYPNPDHPHQMLTLLTGNSDRAILNYLRQSSRRLRQLGDYWVAQEGRIVLLGFFKDEGENAWQPETAREHNLLRDENRVNSTDHFVFITHGKNFSLSEIDSFVVRCEEHLAVLIRRLDLSKNQLTHFTRLTIHLWESAEEKGMFTGNTDLRHANTARNEVHLIWTPELRGDDFFAEANWCIQSLLGECKSAALREGLAVAMTKRWRGVGYEGWAARLVQTQNAPPIQELFDAKIWQAESDLVRQPLLGSFVEFLLEKFGAEEFKTLFHTWPESGIPSRFLQNVTFEQLASAWQEKMRATPAVPLRHAQIPKISASDFHRGFCYAHEGYQIYNGYLGSSSHEALAKLASLGVNAISVTPFGYLRQSNQPDFLRRSDGPGSENDESLLVAKNFAREHDMRVMLKPHILMASPRWGWSGEVRMQTPAAWKIFFDRYERWMRHYAILAEIYDFDMLCVGVELVHATLGHEQEWRRIVTQLRGLYSRPMVYAANWGAEFERLSFWEALEAIGINCYYPLSKKENPSEAELVAGAQQIVHKIQAVAKKFNKPVLITEIGFASMPQTWKNPHEDNREAPVDLEAQRRCYEAIYEVLNNSEQRNDHWLAGIYWWKWPTTLEDGGPADNQFTPNGKPAEKVVAKWYHQIGGEAAATGP